jgi:hypothetical protein
MKMGGTGWSCVVVRCTLAFPTLYVLPYSALQVPITSTFNLHFPLNFLFFNFYVS